MALHDTGADVDVMNEQTAHLIMKTVPPHLYRVTPCTETAEGFTGHPIHFFFNMDITMVWPVRRPMNFSYPDELTRANERTVRFAVAQGALEPLVLSANTVLQLGICIGNVYKPRSRSLMIDIANRFAEEPQNSSASTIVQFDTTVNEHEFCSQERPRCISASTQTAASRPTTTPTQTEIQTDCNTITQPTPVVATTSTELIVTGQPQQTPKVMNRTEQFSTEHKRTTMSDTQWTQGAETGSPVVPAEQTVTASNTLKKRLTTCLSQYWFEKACKDLKMAPNLDLAATFRSKKCERYISTKPEVAAWAVNCFNVPLSLLRRYRLYLHPPTNNLEPYVSLVFELRTPMVVVLPEWPESYWYSAINSVANNKVLLPQSHKIFTGANGRPAQQANCNFHMFSIDKQKVQQFCQDPQHHPLLEKLKNCKTEHCKSITDSSEKQHSKPGKIKCKVNRIAQKSVSDQKYTEDMDIGQLSNLLTEFVHKQLDSYEAQVETVLSENSPHTIKVCRIKAGNELDSISPPDALHFHGINLAGTKPELVFSSSPNRTLDNPMFEYPKEVNSILQESELESDDGLTGKDPTVDFTHEDPLICKLVKAKRMAFQPRNYDPAVDRSMGFTHDILLYEPEKTYAVKPHRCSPIEYDTLKKYIDDYESRGWIQRSSSPWASRVHLVPKKTVDENGQVELRLVIDYRMVNKLSKRQQWSMPDTKALFARITGCTLFSALDFEAGYHHIPMTQEAKQIAAFITPFGLWEPNVLMFGLHSAPATFQRMMDEIFKSEVDDGNTHIYLDDMLLAEQETADCTVEQRRLKHVNRLSNILDKVIQHNMTLKLKKCHFMLNEIEWLGHKFAKGTVSMCESKVQGIADFPRPCTTRQLQRFLGMMIYYISFLRNFQAVAAPLYGLLTGTGARSNIKFVFDNGTVDTTPPDTTLTFKTKKGKKVKVKQNTVLCWDTHCELAFQKLKTMVTSAPCLKLPNVRNEFQIWTDASQSHLAAILEQDGQPIEFWSRRLSDGQKTKYSMYQKEGLALRGALRRWRCYVHNGQKCTLFVDNKSLCQILQQSTVPDRFQASLINELGDLYVEFVHVDTKQQRADPMTRTMDMVNVVTKQSQQSGPHTTHKAATVGEGVKRFDKKDPFAMSPLNRRPPPKDVHPVKHTEKPAVVQTQTELKSAETGDSSAGTSHTTTPKIPQRNSTEMTSPPPTPPPTNFIPQGENLLSTSSPLQQDSRLQLSVDTNANPVSEEINEIDAAENIAETDAQQQERDEAD